jgi:hypothetical protein
MTIAHIVLYAQKPGWLFCDRTEEFFCGNGVLLRTRKTQGAPTFTVVAVR